MVRFPIIDTALSTLKIAMGGKHIVSWQTAYLKDLSEYRSSIILDSLQKFNNLDLLNTESEFPLIGQEGFWLKPITHQILKYSKNSIKQAGTELCHAQEKVRLAMLALSSKKLWSSSI